MNIVEIIIKKTLIIIQLTQPIDEQKKLKATPLWDIDLTNFVYAECISLSRQRFNLTGIKWHIDHIIPLQGKNVTGLHVWNNFRVITAKENLRKKNSFNGDEFG